MYIKSNDFEASIASLLFQPEYYLFDFSANGSTSKFLVTSEENLDLAPFTDIRFEPLAQARFSVSTKKLFSLEGQHEMARPTVHFVFHHAFVCSTLLARCLNQIDAFFSLKEPWIMRRLSDFKRAQKVPLAPTQWREMFTRNVSLLSKNYRGGRSTVIKATNVANNLIDDVMELMPENKLLYLYSSLESFLVSNLKKPAETQRKMPSLFTSFARDTDFDKRFKHYSDPRQLSLLQVCALIWTVNIYNLIKATERHGDSNLLKIHMDVLLSNPVDTLARISKHFGHLASAAELDLMTHPKVMHTNAKDQRQRHGSDVRRQEANLILQTHGRQIQDTMAWIDPLVGELGLLEFLQD